MTDSTIIDQVLCNLYFLGTYYGSIIEETNTHYLVDFTKNYDKPPFSIPVWVNKNDIINEKNSFEN